MPPKHPNTARIGGPGASQENRKQPEKSQPKIPRPQDRRTSWPPKAPGAGTGRITPARRRGR
jgi:hypothetical protein